MRSEGSNALRIGELAELAGTSTRTVRHYHRIGLLDEPERDGSGYRRYGPADVVRLVRIRRLRGLGMPLDQIAAGLDAEGAGGDSKDQLRSLADQLADEIKHLEHLRSRVLDMAASNALDDPAAAWGEALSGRGILASAPDLPPGEAAAAELLDALHRDGIRGVIADSSAVHRCLNRHPGDPSCDVDRRHRLEERRREMNLVIGHQFSPAKRRCMHRIRELLEERAT
jgi:DNA-binding transcriptional MerR regulator